MNQPNLHEQVLRASQQAQQITARLKSNDPVRDWYGLEPDGSIGLA